MPTIAGLRRRGVTPEAIRSFCDLIGVARVDSRVDVEKLEFCIRDDLNLRVARVMCVLRPLKVVIVNYPERQSEQLDAPYYPRDVPKEGSRAVPFSRELYIERDDFQEDPPKNFFRLSPGREVRLRYAYYIKCVDVVKDPATGEVVELRCTYDPDTRGGDSPDGRKVKGTLHWVSCDHSLPATVRLYDRLFRVPNPDEAIAAGELKGALNPESLVTIEGSRIEPSVKNDLPGTRYQFERRGYFVSDGKDSSSNALVYNLTVGLRDTWAKKARESGARSRPESAEQRRKPRSAQPDGQAASKRATKPNELEPEAGSRSSRYTDELGLPRADARLIARDDAVAGFFEDAIRAHENPQHVAKWVVNEVLREVKKKPVWELPFGGAKLGALVALVDGGVISRSGAKLVFAEMLRAGGDPEDIVQRLGVGNEDDMKALEPLVDRLFSENQDKVAAYRAGRTGLLGFFVGQVLKASDGKADPKAVKELVGEKLAQTNE